MSRPLATMTLLNSLELIPGAASYIAGLIQSDEKKRNLACFAIEDILEYRFSKLQDFDPTVRIEVFEEASSFCVRISDKGLPYAVEGFRKKTLENGLVESYVMDQHGSAGQSISLYFSNSGKKRDFKAPEVEEEQLLDDNFSCRLLSDSDEDMLEAIKCLYSAYGYDYLHEDLYFFDSFRRKLNSGTYWTIICENEHHQVVGHAALSNDGMLPGIPEFCCLVTKPFARGKGVADMMLSFAEEFARKMEFEGIVIYPVVYHPYTQKISNKHGYHPVAMHPSMASPASRGLIYRQGDLRGGEVIAEKLLKKPERTLYLPEEYESFVTAVYDDMDIKYSLSHDGHETSAEVSTYATALHPNAQTAFISIDEAGKDLERLTSDFVDSGLLAGMEMIGLYININDPGCLNQYGMFRGLGFSFSGVIIGSTKGDYLYMQWFRKPYPLDTMVLEPNFRKMVDELIAINSIKE